MTCSNKTRVNKLLKYIRHSNHRRSTRYDVMMRRAFRSKNRRAVLRVVNHISNVMRKVGTKLMKRYRIVCQDSDCCLEFHIQAYRERKLEAIMAKRWDEEMRPVRKAPKPVRIQVIDAGPLGLAVSIVNDDGTYEHKKHFSRAQTKEINTFAAQLSEETGLPVRG